MDELQDIHEILSTDTSAPTYEVEGQEAMTIENLSNSNLDRISSCRIANEDLPLSVTLTHQAINIERTMYNYDSRGRYNELRTVLSHCQDTPFGLWGVLFILIFLIGMAALVFGGESESFMVPFVTFMICGFIFFGAFFLLDARFPPYCVIIPIFRSERNTYWSRHGDKHIFNAVNKVVTAIIGAIIALALAWFFGFLGFERPTATAPEDPPSAPETIESQAPPSQATPQDQTPP